MKTIQVKTGFGYFVRDGKVIARAVLPAGEHLTNDDVDYVEVEESELGSVPVEKEPMPETVLIEARIQGKLREMAVAEIKKTDPDFKT